MVSRAERDKALAVRRTEQADALELGLGSDSKVPLPLPRALCAIARKVMSAQKQSVQAKRSTAADGDDANVDAAMDLSSFEHRIEQDVCSYSEPLLPLGDQTRLYMSPQSGDSGNSAGSGSRSLFALSELSIFQEQLSSWKRKYGVKASLMQQQQPQLPKKEGNEAETEEKE